MNDIRSNDDAFDQAMRDRYRLATVSVSAATRAQLRRRRHDAIGDARKHRFSWPLLLSGAAAAMFAIAFGLGLHKETLAPDTAPPPAVAAADSYEEAALALDQDPDFYAWLGSSGAELVAVE